MALIPVGNNLGVRMFSIPVHQQNNSTSSATLDAAGESKAFIGKIFLEGGSGSKTISGAGGGKIRWRSAASTVFSNSGTTLRVGINDVSATGVEDGTHDVYKDLVGNTDTIAANTDIVTTMASGTKTISHGDTIAVVIEMTARGGTDSVRVGSATLQAFGSSSSNFPYGTADTGSGPAKNASEVSFCTIEFDDGTLGWFPPYYMIPGYAAPTAVLPTVSSSPDEYAAVIKLPFRCSVNAAMFYLGSIATTDTFEFILYTDPLGTPAAAITQTIDPQQTGSVSTTSSFWIFFSDYTLQANTWYAFAIRPTSSGTIAFGYNDLGSGNSKYKRMTDFGDNIKMSGRTNQSGAFVEVQTYYLPSFGLQVSKLDDGLDPVAKQQIIGAASTY